MLLRIEIAHKSQVLKFHGLFGKADLLQLGALQILGVDLHILAVAQQFAIDPDNALGIGNEIVEHAAGRGEKVQIRPVLLLLNYHVFIIASAPLAASPRRLRTPTGRDSLARRQPATVDAYPWRALPTDRG